MRGFVCLERLDRFVLFASKMAFLLLFSAFAVATLGLQSVEAFEKVIEHKGIVITISSPKNFTAGKNTFTLSFSKDGQNIATSKVKLRFSMPEMPSMPAMSEEATLSPKDNSQFEGVVSFPHGGTWQIRVLFEVNGVSYQAKSSIDF